MAKLNREPISIDSICINLITLAKKGEQNTFSEKNWKKRDLVFKIRPKVSKMSRNWSKSVKIDVLFILTQKITKVIINLIY